MKPAKKYDKVEVTYTFSIDTRKEEKQCQEFINNSGRCLGINCNECIFGYLTCDSKEIVGILKKMGFKPTK